jgi:hypothetical protein
MGEKIAKWAAIFPVALFLFVAYGYWNAEPILDPLVIYREVSMMDMGGLFAPYLAKDAIAYTAHPPFTNMLTWGLFHIVGTRPVALYLSGFIFFICAVALGYVAFAKIFNRKFAAWFTVLSFCCPLVLMNSYLRMYEIVILAGIALSFLLLSREKRFLFSLSLALFVFTKETAILVPLAFFLLEGWEQIRDCKLTGFKLKSATKRFLVFLPVTLSFLGWQIFMRVYGITEWRAENFGSVKGANSYLVHLNNLLHLKMFEPTSNFRYNLFHAFVFNFHWIYSLAALVLVLSYKAWRSFEGRPLNDLQLKCLKFMAIYGILNVALVLTYETFALTRYVIPVVVVTFFYLALGLEQVENKTIRNIIGFSILGILLSSGFVSADPMTEKFYGRTDIAGQMAYRFPIKIVGDDSYAYNFQFRNVMNLQSEVISNAIKISSSVVSVHDCDIFRLYENTVFINQAPKYHPRYNSKFPLYCISRKNIASSREP